MSKAVFLYGFVVSTWLINAVPPFYSSRRPKLRFVTEAPNAELVSAKRVYVPVNWWLPLN